MAYDLKSLNYKEIILFSVLISGIFNAHTGYGVGILLGLVVFSYLIKSKKYFIVFSLILWLPLFLLSYLSVRDCYSTFNVTSEWVFSISHKVLWTLPLDKNELFSLGIFTIFSYFYLFIKIYKTEYKTLLLPISLIFSGVIFRIIPFLGNKYYGGLYNFSRSLLVSVYPSRMIVSSLQIGFLILCFFCIVKIINYKKIVGIAILILIILSGVHTIDDYSNNFQDRKKDFPDENLYSWIESNTKEEDVIFPGNYIITAMTGRYVFLGRMSPFPYSKNEKIKEFMLVEDPKYSLDILKQNSVKYILIGPFGYVSGYRPIYKGFLEDNGIIYYYSIEYKIDKNNEIKIEKNRIKINFKKFVEPYYTLVYYSENCLIYKANYE